MKAHYGAIDFKKHCLFIIAKQIVSYSATYISTILFLNILNKHSNSLTTMFQMSDRVL